MNYKYKFSVVIPIYNVEDYLEETIESVINQTIGFKKNIQLILVNDGSPDNSGDICVKYKNLFPDNVVYIEKENGGVSSARNEGIKYIEGKYVNFLDSDDIWSENAFNVAYSFLERHYNKIDVLSARVQFFEASKGYHALDYKFKKGNRVADLTTEDEYFTQQTTTATTFIKSEAIGDIRFDKRLKYGEDSTFINKIIIKKLKYGLTDKAIYLYRKRKSGDSAVNKQIYDKAFYTDCLEYYHAELINESKRLYNTVIPYIQALVYYDLAWRFGHKEINEVLSDEEYECFKESVKSILSNIDDDFILKSPIHNNITRKSEALSIKYGVDFFKTIEYREGTLYFRDNELLKIEKNYSYCCYICLFEIINNTVRIDCLVSEWLFDATESGGEFFFKAGKKEHYPFESKPFVHKRINTTGGITNSYRLCRFEFKVKIKKGKTLKIRPFFKFGNDITKTSMSYGKFVPTANHFKPAYQNQNKYIIRYLRGIIKVFKPDNLSAELRKCESKCIMYLITHGKLKEANIRCELPAFKRKNIKNGDIWLFSDRIDNAGDNGEVLFKYVCEHKPEGVRPIFVIGKHASAEVIERLKSIGEVIFFESRKYPLFFLSAKKIISSSGADFLIFNPFGKKKKFLLDLFRFKYYYLQHGVTCADLSMWLNRYYKNIYRMFTSGDKERNAILEADYYYSPEQLVITGQSRFDALYNEPKKQILILPTWRKSIEDSYDEKTVSVYYDGFKETEYFKFYNSLINDERLLNAMRINGYTGLFCIHPIHKEQAVDFEGNDVFRINEGFVDYNKVFAESNAMVTDYSSVLFDFAYLRKPVVYAQFDKEEFFENQTYDEGYFKYERDGFGPVCYNLDDTVDAIIKLVENDCKNDEKYIERVDSFFKYSDSNNSKRILDYILEDDNK